MEKIVYRFQLDCNHIGVQRTIQGLQSGEILARECVIGLVHGSTPIELPTDNSVVAAMYVTRDGVTDVKACTLDTANSTVTYAFDEGDIANAGIVTMQLKLIKTGHGGAERVLFAPKFEVEIEQSDADEDDADDTPTFSALENALAQAQSVYNERLVSVTTNGNYELVFTYADGTTYVTDVVVDAAINAVDIKWAETVEEIQGYVNAASNHEDAAAAYADDSAGYARESSDSQLDSEAYAIGKRNGRDVGPDDICFNNNSKFYANDASNKADSATSSAHNASVSADSAEDSADEAEAWANGQIGGTDVPSTHPAYHNNSKWYKEQASQIVGGEDLVKYTAQSKTDSEKAIACSNIGAVPLTDKGVPNGVASLDNGGRIPYSQLPESAMEYKGTWNASTNTPTITEGVGTNGDFYIVSVAGTWNGIAFSVDDRIIYDGTLGEWHRLGAGSVIDNLNSTSSTSALSANQGNVLKNLIENVFDIKEGEEATVTHIEEFSNGYHRLTGVGSEELYNQLPIEDIDAFNASSCILFVHRPNVDFVRAELYFAFTSEIKVYILPWFRVEDDSPTEADWKMVFGGASVSSGTSGRLAVYDGTNKIKAGTIAENEIVKKNGTTLASPYQATVGGASLSTPIIRNISAGTADLTAGSSSLASGGIYFVYE